MDLSVALRAFGSPEFQKVLANELLKHKNRLPTEKACQVGGWPANEAIIDVTVKAETPQNVLAEVGVSFDEVLNPSCGTAPHHIPRLLTCNLVIDRSTGEGNLRAIEETELPEEF